MTESKNTGDSAARFIERVEKLSNGDLAQLRRAAGSTISARPELLWFAGFARSSATESTDFLIATLLAQFPSAVIRKKGHLGEGSFGSTWRKAIGPGPGLSIRRRFHILLKSDISADGSGDLPYRLRQMIRYAVGKGVGVDWARLLRDLEKWRHPNHIVQKAWARDFFSETVDAP